MLTLDQLQILDRCTSIADVRRVTAQLAAEIGFTFPTYAMCLGPALRVQESTLVVNFPEGWANHYLNHGYDRIDPVVGMAKRGGAPFAISELPADILGEDQRRLLNEARDFAMHDGIIVPIRMAGGVAVLSCVADGGARQRREVIEHQRAGVALLALAVHNACRRLFAESGDPGPLTPRERDCVHWLARGKETGMIGEILGISGYTVAQHLKSAMRKLGCANRIELAVRAVHMGIVSVD
ncbi:transcriptional regulator [Caenispirillum salinarum AK4]|uniref:Transcriptional regulator n=1 Tax=Caenispirillum salinarum AK4 TaxID=1238182 RepID=K9HPM0_9PROT|nr:LuxR family transcriptional regulator [Caenispirillum salinarum]EKV30446.1 transcriptional regulator [Caenispirillum salinarum AK4]